MNEMNPCNFCTLRYIEARNPGKEVTVKVDDEQMLGWWRVYVDDVPQWLWLIEIGRRCTC